MIVIDASAVVELLLQGPRGSRLAQRIVKQDLSLHAPELVNLEVVQVLRRNLIQGKLSESRAQSAVEALQALRLSRYSHAPLVERVWALRNNLSAYDAAYVALAESLEAPLLTLDTRAANASGHRAKVEVLV